MRRAALAAIVLTSVAVSGCGTVANLSGRGWDHTQIYGGVRRDVKATEDWIADYSAMKDTDIRQDVGVGVGVALVSLDTALSAIGDTLTLPITIPVALFVKPSPPTVSQKNAVAAPVIPALAPVTPASPPTVVQK
jgi:uncharacterized protein YceK